MNRSGLRVWIAFLLLCVMWGSSYLFIRIGLRQLTPLSLVGLRLLVGAAGIAVLSTARRQNLRVPRRQRLMLPVVATINTAIPFILISWGETTVRSGLASVLNSTVPIFAVLLAAAALPDERLTLPKLAGVAVGFAGVVVLLSRDLLHGGITTHLLDELAIVAASVCYAIGAVLVRRTLRGVPALTVATYTVMVAAIEMMGLSLIFSRPSAAALNGGTIFAVLWLGLLGTALAYNLSFFVLGEWGAARYTLVAYMLPVTGLTLGVLVLHDPLTWQILAGSALVVAGIGLANIRPRVRSAPVTPGVEQTA